MTTLSHDNFELHRLLTDQGAYVHEHNPETFEDCGDAENGPCLEGGPAFDRYSGDSHEFIMQGGCVIATTLEIDWDLHRYFASLAEGGSAEEVESAAYQRPRHAGEDYIVTMRDEDGTWYACHGYGWTDVKSERGYFTQTHAEQTAARFNAKRLDYKTGPAKVHKVETP